MTRPQTVELIVKKEHKTLTINGLLYDLFNNGGFDT